MFSVSFQHVWQRDSAGLLSLVMTKEGCHESTRITDRSGGDPLQRYGLRAIRAVRQGQSPAAATGRN